jgi:hypothetical protein
VTAVDPAYLDHARAVADAILYEGYLLYPYRGSAQKNQMRFQFGVVMPPAYESVDASEPSAIQAECLLECTDATEIQVLVRFLQIQRRTVQALPATGGAYLDVPALEVAGSRIVPWDETVERECRTAAKVSQLLVDSHYEPFRIKSGETMELIPDGGEAAGRLRRRWPGLLGLIRLRAERVAGPYQALRLQARVENLTQMPVPPRLRQDGLGHALIAAHMLIGTPGGRFISMTDPPQWAAAAVSGCENAGTWPVLAGPPECHELMLCSPVILYDHPEIAGESAGSLYDGTEIDEILTLRTMALTDAEKREARATEPRAAELIDRVSGMSPELLERMHGAIRYPEGKPERAVPEPESGPRVPWWDPGLDASVSPETDHVIVGGTRIARGSRVLMRPGARRADAQDLFLAGREAIVEAVLHDVDDQVHLAVTPCGDPAADLNRRHGRFLYFAPDEVSPAEPASSMPSADSRREEEAR